MRGITRSHLAPIFIAAAVLITGLSAHQAAAGITSHRVGTEAGPYCPASTNWNDALQQCVPD